MSFVKTKNRWLNQLDEILYFECYCCSIGPGKALKKSCEIFIVADIPLFKK